MAGEGFAAVRGGSIWYRVVGDGGAGGSVVLISGLGADETIWAPVLRSLGGFTVIRFHNRGIGRSCDIPSAEWSTRDSAGDVIAVLDALGIERARIYGHSLGGRMAQWVAADHPGRVEKLVLGATTVGDAHGVGRTEAATRAFGSGDPRAALELVFSPAYLDANPDVVARTTSRASSPGQAERQFAMSTAHDAWDALPRIVAPTLVVHGTDDGVTPVGNATILNEHIPGSDLLLLRGARHAYFVERPDANAMIAAFLAG